MLSCNPRMIAAGGYCSYLFLLILGIAALATASFAEDTKPNLDKTRALDHRLPQAHKHQQRQKSGRFSLRNDSAALVGFTSWSDWSLCDRYCSQNRVKKCRAKKKCGNAVIRFRMRISVLMSKRLTGGTSLQSRRSRTTTKMQTASAAGGSSEKSKFPRCTDEEQTLSEITDLLRRYPKVLSRVTDGGRSKKRRMIGSQATTASGASGHLVRNLARRNAIDKYDLNVNGIENSTANEGSNWKCGVSKKNTRLSYFTRIIGGRPTVPGSWPWQVAVLNRYGVDYSITHPRYNAHTVDNDIALLRLPITLTPSDSRGIACLPAPWQELPSDQLCTIIGWGKANASHEFGTDVLHEARIPIVSDDMCRNVYIDYKITSNMFCAGYRRGRMDSCAGDSGGPLLCKDPEKSDHPWTIFGITSFGEGCGKRGKYGIYARLSNYVHWIAKIIKQTDAYTN
ncbi:hypothetical protein TSAR_004174 [Trichomalopsis sarcophagae]|uniref:Peptidase S1 domain-containing protein n=1 Tax=Trichomalopsis sarcophagae TaxID=543379 RepID=A0A232FHD2_9HYME|nr:hypothetical protein TSAR_004174 [Trichomalopsis sarcophagae]